jgi:deoxycytidine triphosphate deaminase
MILSAKKVLELNGKHKLIEGLSEREEKNPEGVGFDLRLAEVFTISGEGFLGVTERKTPTETSVASAERGDKEVTIKPGEYVLVKTMEKVNLPPEKIEIEEGEKPRLVMTRVHPRSTLHRAGIYFMATKVDPGYSGPLVFALANLSKSPFRIEIGARFANVTFEQVVGDISRAYEGQWQGGRVSANKKEKQN